MKKKLDIESNRGTLKMMVMRDEKKETEMTQTDLKNTTEKTQVAVYRIVPVAKTATILQLTTIEGWTIVESDATTVTLEKSVS